MADAHWDQVQLLLHCEGTNGSTTITDSARYNVLTASGNAQISTAQYRFGTSSLYVNAPSSSASNYVSFPHSTQHQLGALDFTIECEFRWASYSSTTFSPVFVTKRGASSNFEYEFGYFNGALYFYYSTDGTTLLNFNVAWTPPATGTWYHIAVARSGSNLRFFVDGVQVGSTQTMTSTIYSGTETVKIFGDGTNSVQVVGYMDELRITVGYCRYTANFTRPSAEHEHSGALADPLYSYVQLLAHCHGTAGSTTFTDTSQYARALSRAGTSIAISTTQSKWGQGALYEGTYNDGSNYVQVTTPSSFPLIGTQNYCLEGWFRWDGYGGGFSMFRLANASGDIIVCSYLGPSYGTQRIRFLVSQPGVGSSTMEFNVSLLTNTWHHIAFVKEVGATVVHRCYLDGVSLTKSSGGDTAWNVTTGSYNQVAFCGVQCSTAQGLHGYANDIRFTVGNCRYKTNFLAPSAPASDFAYDISGVVTDQNDNPIARTVRVYHRDTGLLIDETTSNASTGAYTVYTLTNDAHCVVALPNATDENAIIYDRVIPV